MRRKLTGFTLLELVIAMALGAVFLLLSSSALIQSAKTNRIAQEHAYLQEGAFIAKAFIEKDLRRAGYYAGLKSTQEITGTSKIVPFDKKCAKASDQFARQLFPKIFGLNNFAKDFLCVEKHYLNSDILSMHYLRPTESVNRAANKSDMLYMRVSTTQGRFFKARDQANSSNQIIDEHNELYELVALIYYVRDTGRRCDDAVIPGLYREYNNASGFMEAEEIVSGVEQLQIQYSINGMLFNADEITGEKQWQSVDAVSVWLLMRSDCFEFSAPNDRQFQMGDIYFDERYNNKNYLRQLYKFDISLRN